MKWKRSLAGRMLAFSLVVSSVLLIILGSVLTGLSGRVLQDEVAEYSEKMLIQTKRLLDSSLESICSRIIRLTSLPSITACMTGPKPSAAQSLAYERETDESLTGIDLFLPIEDVLILGENGYVYNLNRRQNLDSSYHFTGAEWYRRAVTVENGVYIQLLSLHDQLFYSSISWLPSRQRQTISLSMAVRSPSYETIGAIVCTLDMSEIAELFVEDTHDNDERIALLDSLGTVCVRSDNAGIGERLSLKDADYEKLYASSSGYFTARMDGMDYLICHDTSDFCGWKLVSCIPLRSIRAHAAPLHHFFVAALLGGLLLNLILAVFYARSIRRPVDALTQSLSQVEVDADSLSLIPVRREFAELEQVSEKFNELLEHIDLLIRKDYRTQLELSRFELAALQAQINPHFLFNTLQLLQTEILYGNVEKSNRIIITLSQLMRYYMTSGESAVPVAREIEYLEKYLMLFASKYEGRLTTRFDVQPEAEALSMPKLLIQPVVENSIRHAADVTPGAISISIGVYLRDGDLIISVEDDGCGIDENRLKEVRESLDRRVDWMKNSIGLANVHQRIRTVYGPGYGLSIDSGPDGTVVLLRLPGNTDEGGAV